MWNAVLITVMQTSLEFGFVIYFQLKYATWDGSFGVWVNFVYAYLMLGLVIFIPIFMTTFYWYNYERITPLSVQNIN